MNQQSRVVLVCFVLLLCSICFSCVRGDDEFCFSFQLENECSEVIQRTFIPKEEQENEWKQIEMQISDIRMLNYDCRRPLVWFLCSSVFGECGSENQTDTDINPSLCEEVNEECGGDILDCSNDQSPFVLSRIVSSLPSSFSSPIPVITCLENPNTHIECCPDPYTLSSITEECVISCPPTFYKEQEGLLIANYVFFFFSFGVLILAFIPYIFLPELRVFPKYALAMSMLYMLCFSICLNWSLFVGVEFYVCGSERESGSFYDFVESSRCTIQQAFWTFFTFSSFFWFALVNIFLHNLVHQNEPPHLKKLFGFFAKLTRTDAPDHRRNEILVHVVCFIFAGSFSLICSLSSRFTDNAVPAIPAFYCTYRADHAGWVFWSFYLSVYGSILALYFLTLFALIRKGWVLLRFHVRIVLFFGISFVQFFIFALTAFYFRTGIDDWPVFQTEYAECVATRPREAGKSGCELEDDGNFWWFVIVAMGGSLWPGLWGIIGFLSTQTCLRFGFIFLFVCLFVLSCI